MFNFIRNIFSKNETNLDIIKQKLCIFIEDEKLSYNALNVTEINKKEDKDTIYVYITLVNTNNLIGERGEIVQRLKDYLTKCFKKEIDIIIHESNVWNINYEKVY